MTLLGAVPLDVWPVGRTRTATRAITQVHRGHDPAIVDHLRADTAEASGREWRTAAPNPVDA